MQIKKGQKGFTFNLDADVIPLFSKNMNKIETVFSVC